MVWQGEGKLCDLLMDVAFPLVSPMSTVALVSLSSHLRQVSSSVNKCLSDRSLSGQSGAGILARVGQRFQRKSGSIATFCVADID
jgi:hypothetical protein